MTTTIKTILSTILILLILLIIIFILYRPLIYNLSSPKNLKSAKENGEQLLQNTDKNIVIVTAHPDDAEWYAGGTIIQLSKNNNVYLALGTSGEKGANANNIGKIREEKQKKAAKIIGYKEVYYLRNPDRGLTNNKYYRGQLKEIFIKTKTDIVITFDPFKQGFLYHHPDHLAAGQTTTQVVKKMNILKTYYFHSSQNNTIVDFSSVKSKKADALKLLFNYTTPGFAQKLFSSISFGKNNHFSYGFNNNFSKIDIKNGECFRKY